MRARAKLSFLLPGLWLLGACVTTAPVHIDRYRLEAAPPAPPAAGAVRPTGGVLKLSAVLAPAWLQGTGMCYRFAFRDPVESRRYADSRWAAPPGSMLAQSLQDALTATGHWRAVLGPDDPAAADTVLRIHLLDLCQVFGTPTRSSEVLAARATVMRGLGVLGQRTFRYRVPAPTRDAAGGVRAASTGLRRFSAALARWLTQFRAPTGATN